MPEKRTSARDERAKARAKRRDGATADGAERADTPADTAKHAAAAAAASALVSGAASVAKHLIGERSGGNGDDDRDEPEPKSKAEPRPEPEPEGAKEERAPRGAPASEAAELVDVARRQLESVLGSEVERVSGIRRAEGSWKIGLEVVEFRRIPDSTDILASYEVELDGDRNLVGVTRLRRYRRADAEGA
jgi:hypothetical protein